MLSDYLTKEDMIKKCLETSKYSTIKGGFINTDGYWCTCTTPEAFEKFIVNKGFEVIDCKSTSTSTAKAVTSEGYIFFITGFVPYKPRRLNMTKLTLRYYDDEIIKFLDSGSTVVINDGCLNDRIISYSIEGQAKNDDVTYLNRQIIYTTSACVFPKEIQLSDFKNITFECFQDCLFIYIN